jgi:hypothetical protein
MERALNSSSANSSCIVVTSDKSSDGEGEEKKNIGLGEVRRKMNWFSNER